MATGLTAPRGRGVETASPLLGFVCLPARCVCVARFWTAIRGFARRRPLTSRKRLGPGLALAPRTPPRDSWPAFLSAIFTVPPAAARLSAINQARNGLERGRKREPASRNAERSFSSIDCAVSSSSSAYIYVDALCPASSSSSWAPAESGAASKASNDGQGFL